MSVRSFFSIKSIIALTFSILTVCWYFENFFENKETVDFEANTVESNPNWDSRSSGLVNKASSSDNELAKSLDKLGSQFRFFKTELEKQKKQLSDQQQVLTGLYNRLDSMEGPNGDNSEGAYIDADTVGLNEIPEEEDDGIMILNNEFELEIADSDWSDAAVNQIAEVFSADNLEGSVVTDLNCHSTLCRISVEHNTMEELGRFADDFPRLLGWQTQMRIQEIDNGDGSMGTLIFVAREGSALKSPGNG